MRKALRILALVLALVALMGAEQSCEQRDRNKPGPKATTTGGTPVKRTVDVRAYSKGPYHVMFIVTDPKTNGLQRRFGPELVGGGEYRQQIEYDSGEVVGIQILVWGNIADTMRCSITDGPKVDSQTKPREVLCILHTSR